MSSAQRTIAQRNNNVQSIVPTGSCLTGNYIDLDVNPLFTKVAINNVINVDVRNITPKPSGTAPNTNHPAILFNIVYDETIAAHYPGLEFTIFFDAYKSSALNDVTIVVKTMDRGNPTESYYPFSAVSGEEVQVLSVTLKSNGRVFSVISTGPSYWS